MKTLYKSYVFLVDLIGLLIVIYFSQSYNYSDFKSIYLVFFIITMISDLYSEEIQDGVQVSLNSIFLIFFVFTFDPFIAIIIAIFSSINHSIFSKTPKKFFKDFKKQIHLLAYNTSIFIICLSLIIYIKNILNFDIDNQFHLLTVFLAVLGFNLVNIGLLCIGFSIKQKKIVISLFKSVGVWLFFVINFTTSALLIYNYHHMSIAGIILVLIAFFLIQKTLTLYLKISNHQEELFKDYLTGTYNRRYLTSMVDKFIESKEPFLLIFIDLDEFKAINDEHGHLVGDELLKSFITHIISILPHGSTFYRYGGDEFCITSVNETDKLIDILNSERNKFSTHISNKDVHVKFTFGYSYYFGQETNLKELLEEADRVMYANKG